MADIGEATRLIVVNIIIEAAAAAVLEELEKTEQVQQGVMED
jgi:hypothetical protein